MKKNIPEKLTIKSFSTSGNRKKYLVYKRDPTNQRLGLWNTFVVIFASLFGTDPYFLGGGMDCGFGLVLFLLIFILLLDFLSYYIMMKCWVYDIAFSYRSLWEMTFGKYFAFIPDLLIFLNYLGWTMYYFGEAYDMLLSILDYFFADMPSWVRSKWFITYGITSFTSLNILFIRELSDFLVLSYIKIICSIIPTIINVWKLIDRATTPGFSIANNILWPVKNWEKIIAFIAYAGGVFGNNALIEHQVQFMHEPSYERVTSVYVWANTIGFLFIMLNSFIGVFIFSQDTYYTSFLYMFDPNESGIIISKICCYIYILITSYIFQWMEGRHIAQMFSTTWELCNWEPVWWIPHVAASIIAILLNATCHYMQSTSLIYSNLLAMAGFLTSYYVLVPLFYIINFAKDQLHRTLTIISVLFLILGLIVLSYCVVANLIMLVSEENNPLGFN